MKSSWWRILLRVRRHSLLGQHCSGWPNPNHIHQKHRCWTQPTCALQLAAVHSYLNPKRRQEEWRKSRDDDEDHNDVGDGSLDSDHSSRARIPDTVPSASKESPPSPLNSFECASLDANRGTRPPVVGQGLSASAADVFAFITQTEPAAPGVLGPCTRSRWKASLVHFPPCLQPSSLQNRPAQASHLLATYALLMLLNPNLEPLKAGSLWMDSDLIQFWGVLDGVCWPGRSRMGKGILWCDGEAKMDYELGLRWRRSRRRRRRSFWARRHMSIEAADE
ncbi:hypothetical protein GALMADRAFT_137426 [Galerina marginata CBS 339.88]|uniref:Uncharacterized protein n=1 Tax=Galerina marginata (strain CBS 339.88) TaxID=685588 RepID=A0A067T909_GALM3|nr:hypothetical protein GALMADRAFT_137426 [Galerina marginata CBS 339.88]